MSSNNFSHYLTFLLLIILSIPLSISAVDGYKNLKFGMTKNQILQCNVCSFTEANSGQVGVEYLSCPDFAFGDSFVTAGAFFINNEFLRFMIIPSVDMVSSLASGLINKYGPVSAQSTQYELEAVDKYPNKSAFLAFDNNTVILKVISDQNYIQNVLLLYTSLKYDVLLLKGQKRSIGNDL